MRGRKFQITVSEDVAKILEREAEKRKMRLLTYIAMVLSKTVLEQEHKERFNDGFG